MVFRVFTFLGSKDIWKFQINALYLPAKKINYINFKHMSLIIFMMILCALFDDHDKKPSKSRKSYRKYKKDNSWLDNAWFHDHGQHI